MRYYRVQQNVRGMIPIHAVTVHAHPGEPVAWYLAYRYVGDRATCEALAAAAGIVVDPPELPPGTPKPTCWSTRPAGRSRTTSARTSATPSPDPG